MVSDPRPVIDVEACEALVGRVVSGDENAWKELVHALWPALLRLSKASRTISVVGRSEDTLRDVATAVIQRLGGHDGRGLKQYTTWRARHPDKTFADWLRIVTKNVQRDMAREQHAPSKRPTENAGPSVNGFLNEFMASADIEALGSRPPMTAAQTARQLLEFASSHLPEDQCAALARWIEGATFEDIDAELGVAAGDGRKLLRAAVAALRRRFVPGAKSGPGP